MKERLTDGVLKPFSNYSQVYKTIISFISLVYLYYFNVPYTRNNYFNSFYCFNRLRTYDH